MRLGLSMLFCLNEPLRYALKRLNHIEVEHVEIIDEGPHELNESRIEIVRRNIIGRGLHLSVHAPFADINIASTSPSIRRAIMKRLKRSIRLSAKLNPEYWVFHPGIRSAISDIVPGLDWRINLESVRELLSEAEQYGLRMALENVPETFPFILRRINDFKMFFDSLGDEGSKIGITLDVGHANINGQLYNIISAFRSKIVHTHLHDNNGDRDSHLGIGFGNINWPRLMESLREINYSGALVIESISNVEESIEALRNLIRR